MTRKTTFFEGWSWFKFNTLGLALGIILRFYTSLSKGWKLKVRKFCCLISTFVEVTGEKLVGGASWIGLISSNWWIIFLKKIRLRLKFELIWIFLLSNVFKPENWNAIYGWKCYWSFNKTFVWFEILSNFFYNTIKEIS